jgi:hypothetical protein
MYRRYPYCDPGKHPGYGGEPSLVSRRGHEGFGGVRLGKAWARSKPQRLVSCPFCLAPVDRHLTRIEQQED